MLPNKKTIYNNAFTLIELLIVIAVLGMLSTFVVISFTGATDRAEDAKRQTELSQYQTLLEVYASNNNNSYPASASPASNLCGILNATSCTNDPDPSKNYHYQSNGSQYVLWAQLDVEDKYFVMCSTGVSKTIEATAWSAPSGGTCP